MKFAISALLLIASVSAAFGNQERIPVLSSSPKPFEFTIVYEPRDADVYNVMFALPKNDLIKDFFGIDLFIGNDLTRYKGLILRVSLHQQWTEIAKKDDYSTNFLVKKDLFEKATLVLRCGNPIQERAYYIKLSDFATRHKTEQGAAANP